MNMKQSLVELSNVAKIFNGKTPAKKEQRLQGHPVLKIKDVSNSGYFNGCFQSYVDPSFITKNREKIINQEDTLILNAAHNANYVASKIYKAEKQVEGSLATGEWTIIRSDKINLDPIYAYYWLLSQKTRFQLRQLVKGIHLYPKDVARLKIPLPPLEEQKRIARILDKADEIRRKRKQAIALTDELLRSTFLDMFGDPVINPKGWEVKKLGQILEVLHRYPTFYGCEYVNVGVPVLKISSIGKDYIFEKDLLKYDKVTQEFSEKFPKTIVKSGDLVMAVRGDTTGKIGIVPPELANSNISPNLIRISPNPKLCNSQYLFWVFRCGQLLIEKRINNTAKKSLTATTLRQVPIPLPPKTKQEQFLTLFNKISSLRSKQNFSSQQSENLFNSLLQRAFKGEL